MGQKLFIQIPLTLIAKVKCFSSARKGFLTDANRLKCWYTEMFSPPNRWNRLSAYVVAFLQKSYNQTKTKQMVKIQWNSTIASSTWLTYCESLTSMQMSVFVPTPFGSLARASWTRTMNVTNAGRVEKRRGWGFTLFDADEEWLMRTGPTAMGAGWSGNKRRKR